MSEFQYDETYFIDYFKQKNGAAYGYHEPWLSFFGTMAERLVKQFRPETVMDVGCAMGLLVSALRTLDVFAWGVDISEYAVTEGNRHFGIHHPQMILPPLSVHDIRKRYGGLEYSLVVCIEVLEHVPAKDVDIAVTNVAKLVVPGGYLVFSSDAEDEENPSHENVQPASYWVEKFEAQGLKRRRHFDVSYINEHAMVFRKGLAHGFDST